MAPIPLSIYSRVLGSPGTSWTCPECLTIDDFNLTVHPVPESQEAQGHPRYVRSVPLQMAPIPLSIPSQSPRKPRYIPGLSHSRWLQFPTVHPIPESGEAQGHPGYVPSVQLWRALTPLSIRSQSPRKARDIWTCPERPTVEGSNPLSIPFQSLRKPGDILDMSGVWRALIPLSMPSQSPGKPRDIPDMSRASHSGWLQSQCPSHPRDIPDMS